MKTAKELARIKTWYLDGWITAAEYHERTKPQPPVLIAPGSVIMDGYLHHI